MLLPEMLLAGLDFSRGIGVVKESDGLRLKPVHDADDPFGFGAAALAMLAEGHQASLSIPDVFPEDIDNIKG